MAAAVHKDPIDVVFTLDTTGSMSACLSAVRRQIESLTHRLFTEIPGLRIGLICHGDYCDAGSSYVTKALDLTHDELKVTQFIREVGATGGGDAPECYELVLHEARSLAWKSGRSKVLCMVGDDVPHGPTYPQNTKKLDWRNELGLLLESSIHVYGVQCLNRGHATPFWTEVARATGGFHLALDQFSSLPDLIMAVCYKQESPERLKAFEDEVRAKGRMNRNVDALFATLGGRAKDEAFKSTDLTAVPPGRFQILTVETDQAIKEFVTAQGLRFRVGRGFYEFQKRETIQGYKEVVLQDRKTGDLFTGTRARELLGLPAVGTMRLAPAALDTFRVFIQSTSSNRKLVGGTHFLYEVEDAEGLGARAAGGAASLAGSS